MLRFTPGRRVLARLGVVAGFALVSTALLVGSAQAIVPGPYCGDVLTQNTKLVADLDCSGTGNTGLILGAPDITLNLNGHALIGDSDYAGVDFGYSGDTVKNGAIVGAYWGAYVNGVARGTVNHVSFFDNWIGVALLSTNGNTVKSSFFEENFTGVDLQSSTQNLVANNAGYDNYELVYTEYETSDVFKSNTSEYSEYGFYDDYSNLNTYQKNVVTEAESDGFYWDSDDQGVVIAKSNTANYNGGNGFDVSAASNLTTTGSQFTNNTANGNSHNGFYDSDSYAALYKANTAVGNGWAGFDFEYPSSFVVLGNTANNNADDEGFYIGNNSGSYNVSNFSNNKANNNDYYGFYAQYPAPGSGNHSVGNVVACVNVVCKAGSTAPVLGTPAEPPVHVSPTPSQSNPHKGH